MGVGGEEDPRRLIEECLARGIFELVGRVRARVRGGGGISWDLDMLSNHHFPRRLDNHSGWTELISQPTPRKVPAFSVEVR